MTSPTEAPLLDYALAVHAAGYCVVPPTEDGVKKPISTWKRYMTERPTEAQVRAWYGNGRAGIGVICGHVSGGLELFEFEGRAVEEGLLEAFVAAADAAGYGDLVNLIVAGYSERSPSGGIHWLYRCDVTASTKLARRPATPEELAAEPDDNLKTLVETKGEGGYCIVAPSAGPVHPSGAAWELLAGSFETIVTITPEERDDLHRIARSLDKEPPKAVNDGPMFSPAMAALNGINPLDPRPGDLYNNDPAAPRRTLDLLVANGWTVVFRRGDDLYLRRPGKDKGHSAVLHTDTGVFVNWSTSTAFEGDGAAYSPFSVYATLQHGGDFSVAARAVRDLAGPRSPADTISWALEAEAAAKEAAKAAAETAGNGEAAEGSGEADPPTWQLPNPTIDEFLGEPEPDYQWLIPGILERGDRVIVTAGEGVGKSTFIRQLAVQAAAGIHPFTEDSVPPIRVVYLDLENSRRHVRREMRPLRDLAGTDFDPARLTISVVPEGIDLMHADGLVALDDLLQRTAPDLVAVGPLYKLATGDPKDEEQAQAVRRALDHYRAKYDCAFIIEAHQPYATGSSSKRPLRPYGASLWSRWPEFGIALDSLPGAPVADIRHWRGARDERSWPAALQRSGGGDHSSWPWTIANDKQQSYAGMCEIAREHIAATGKLPSVREVAARFVDKGFGVVSKSTVERAINNNRDHWTALLEAPEWT